MVIDPKYVALDGMCITSQSMSFGTTIGTLIRNLEESNAYAGSLLSVANVAKLDAMCSIAKTTTLGTVANGLLTASKNVTTVARLSDVNAALINKMCINMQTAGLGTQLQLCADRINKVMASVTAFTIASQTGDTTINPALRTIALTMPFGTDPAALIATFTLGNSATAKVGSTAQESGVTANDFTDPVVYTITSSDTLVALNWTVTVTIATE